MTLVFDRRGGDDAIQGPGTHAIVIGIGRFPELAEDKWVQSCADSGREVVKFLDEQKDQFVKPLKTIRCLISDPTVTPGQDEVPLTSEDPRNNTLVDNGTTENVLTVFKLNWIPRNTNPDGGDIEQGDNLLIYFCSHGVSARDDTANLVLEDIRITGISSVQWRQLLDVKAIAANIRDDLTNAGDIFIFMDACREVIPILVLRKQGVDGETPYLGGSWFDVEELAKPVVALTATTNAIKAFAPKNGGVAFFTEALLIGLKECCVESRFQQGVVNHFVTGKMLRRLSALTAALDLDVRPGQLGDIDEKAVLLKVEKPKYYFNFSTNPEKIMRNAQLIELQEDSAKIRAPAEMPVTSGRWQCNILHDPPHNLGLSILSPAPTAPISIDIIPEFPALTVTYA